MAETSRIPVIDLFAGPGGLGEGFSAFEPVPGERPFQIRHSIEKEVSAHQTLQLRSFFRQFERENVPELYYDLLRGRIPLAEFPGRLKTASAEWFGAWQHAESEAVHAELGASDKGHADLSRRIARAVEKTGGRWVLIGGPPCQAYSLVGRSRNQGKANYRIEDDLRSSLYREYLRIIADHWPAVFVMENVKGMISAKVDGRPVFERILQDLQRPKLAMSKKDRGGARFGYRIEPIVVTRSGQLARGFEPRDFIVECEKYGIPQQRHRVILVGIRKDLGDVTLPRLQQKKAATIRQVIGEMPSLRSGVSRTEVKGKFAKMPDTGDQWLVAIRNQTLSKAGSGPSRWLRSLRSSAEGEVADKIEEIVRQLTPSPLNRGGPFIPCPPDLSTNDWLGRWLMDERLGGVCNHESRTHMDRDLGRYLFASAYGDIHKESPRLDQFPSDLLPNHENAESGHFDDRFRVQLADRASTTITSHISKDGHYFIHFDPSQCRSLTVREAARLQTFPDNYLFCGPRTAQYIQVGNAVPPLLALQIAESVWKLLNDSRQVET